MLKDASVNVHTFNYATSMPMGLNVMTGCRSFGYFNILLASFKSGSLSLGEVFFMYDATKVACGKAQLPAHIMLPAIYLYESYSYFYAVSLLVFFVTLDDRDI